MPRLQLRTCRVFGGPSRLAAARRTPAGPRVAIARGCRIPKLRLPRHVAPPVALASANGQPEANSTEEDTENIVASVAGIEPPGTTNLMEVKHLRHILKPRDNPFVDDPDFGFVEDGEIVNLESLRRDEALEHQNGASSPTTSSHNEYQDRQPKWGLRIGPRRRIYFDPGEVTAAIVTCGGVCPGVNFVIQNIVRMLCNYGVPEQEILGVKYGLRGLRDRSVRPMNLTRGSVAEIHTEGGSILGTSRGWDSDEDIEEIVRRMSLWDLRMLFVIGGRLANMSAFSIQQECERQGLACAVVSVPKSVDNSIAMVDRSFGFDSAVTEAQRALRAAKVEATSARRGVGLVKLMGKCNGFVAMEASMASGLVDICLIPEAPFSLERVCDRVSTVLGEKGHCVICVAEGAGNHLLQTLENPEEDDMGQLLKNTLVRFFEGDVDVKYIDPTYMIRAGPPSTVDSIYCKVLGQAAVHGAFAGYTGVTIGMVNTHYVLLPTDEVMRECNEVNVKGRRWSRLTQALRQPDLGAGNVRDAEVTGNGAGALKRGKEHA